MLLGAALTVGGYGVASAATDNGGSGGPATTTTVPGQAPPATPPAPEAGPGRHGPFHHHKGGFGAGIHGEFVTPKQGGGYQTVATQTGTVTAVSADSITVRSEDGFSRTYVVDDNTSVNAGRTGITSIRQDDTVHVTAIVEGGTARAVSVRDTTLLKAQRDRWAPGPRTN